MQLALLTQGSRSNGERTIHMYDTARGALHYIAADLDSRAWVEIGFARLEDYLACWRLFGELHPSDPR
jgi:hypothetical protein